MQKQATVDKVKTFNKSLKLFHEGFEKSKDKMKILSKYNILTKKYERSIPTDPGEETRQSVEDK